MLVGIDHIGIAVANLDEATEIYVGVLGAQSGAIHMSTEAGIRARIISIGDMKVELMEPVNTEGPVAEFIRKRGEGVHHICLEVDNITKELEFLSVKGVKLVDKEAKQGLGGKIAFIHPKAMNGVLIELVEKAA